MYEGCSNKILKEMHATGHATIGHQDQVPSYLGLYQMVEGGL